MLIKETWLPACRNKMRRKISRPEVRTEQVLGRQAICAPGRTQRGPFGWTVSGSELQAKPSSFTEQTSYLTIAALAPTALPLGDGASHSIFPAVPKQSGDTHKGCLRCSFPRQNMSFFLTPLACAQLSPTRSRWYLRNHTLFKSSTLLPLAALPFWAPTQVLHSACHNMTSYICYIQVYSLFACQK